MTDELPLEYASYDHYTVEVRKGPLHEEKTLRHHEVKDADAATNLIEGFRETYAQRENVTWTTEEVNEMGKMYGMAPGSGDVYVIAVSPPLSVALS